LTIIAQAEELLATNVELSNFLTAKISDLVQGANTEIADSNLQAASIQAFNTKVLIGVVVLSLVSSFLIVWLYVGRNLIARLTALSDSMLAIAGGNLRAPLPAPGGGDEISRMAKALVVFRNTAIEVEESNLRDIEEARRRLVDAIENSSEGFAFYDPDDRLVICNTRYQDLLYPDADVDIEPGMAFETIIRSAAENGQIVDAEGRIDEWVAGRVALHENPGEPRIQQRRGSQWILITERKTGDGGTVAIYSDITDLKQREEDLTSKSNALEQLSNQLAKYLSPQIYNSIFTGKQEVKLVSQRKRLTVFFSDLVGFTDTTEKLESEDLTQLLNQYLTEMSQIALAHGATIDKYVGDAIVIFLGDPETLGVNEDALACVKMAIAMRKRMKELESVWKNSGLENPLQCRMGINTGMCTVGNFGSEDRMDYTIIGGGVNLASRLESACPANEILISYETFAHVREQIRCEEHGEIEVKGIAYPIGTYRVVDSYESLGRERRQFHEEHSNVRLDIDLEAMTNADREPAADMLNRALDLITDGVPPKHPE
jgi:class 3 adenylate cyclase/HAMP domain-containing protein